MVEDYKGNINFPPALPVCNSQCPTMNPSLSPYPNSSFPFFSPTHNPNPNANFIKITNSFSPFPQPPPPQFHPPSPDLPTTLSTLKSLIDLTHQTLTNLSSIIPPKPQTENHVSCPAYPHHRMPAESLFHHHLHCPSDLGLDTAVETLNYPETIKSTQHSAKEHRFVEKVADPNAACYFTFDDYTDFSSNSNFFYRDCPGVVDFPIKDEDAKKGFVMPGFLLLECADHIATNNGQDIKLECSEKKGFRVLPSEFWMAKNEIDRWNDYPDAYSYNLLCLISCMGMIRVNELCKWAIVNSPLYGVVIDAPMRDHIVVLLVLCLKAIMKEGVELLEEKYLGGKEGILGWLKCPKLVKALTWLASQLSILYGEVNGKFITINFLKECVAVIGSRMLLFPLDRVSESSSECNRLRDLGAGGCDLNDLQQEESLRGEESELASLLHANVNSKAISVSEVAAAIAVLHKRSSLEQKIRTLRGSQSLSRYQRLIEHADVSKLADEERRSRPDYRPIIDHDGLPRQKPSIEEEIRTKTREELLAEERDYKRRRTSYRGKKSKRSTSEVMRDIIEEYMEEIKQAGGIGFFEKHAEAGTSAPRSPSDHGVFNSNVNVLGKGSYDDGAHGRRQPELDSRSTWHIDTSKKDNRARGDYISPRDSESKIRTDVQRRNRDSRSPDRSGRWFQQHSIQRERDVELSKHKLQQAENYRDERRRDRYERYKQSIHNDSRSSINQGKDDKLLKNIDKRRGKRYERHSSDSSVENMIEDRYIPPRLEEE